VKVAVTVVAALTPTVQLLAVPHPPPVHPLNVYPVPAVSVSSTCVPLAKLLEHVPGQLIPVGLLLTVPVPVTCTVKG